MVSYSIGDKVQIDANVINGTNNDLHCIPREYILKLIRDYGNKFTIYYINRNGYVSLNEDICDYNWHPDMINSVENIDINIHEAFKW